jgi:hypothetical protein
VGIISTSDGKETAAADKENTMPRVENAGDAVTQWCQATGNGSSLYEVCQDCLQCGLVDTLQPYVGDPDGEWMILLDESPGDFNCEVCGKKTE